MMGISNALGFKQFATNTHLSAQLQQFLHRGRPLRGGVTGSPGAGNSNI